MDDTECVFVPQFWGLSVFVSILSVDTFKLIFVRVFVIDWQVFSPDIVMDMMYSH